MNILVVEDSNEYIEEISSIINTEAKDCSLTICKHLTSAMQEIKNNYFDLIILDLSIPTDDNSLDESPNHGHSVLRNARVEASGTPIIVLTGSSAEDFIESMLEMSEKSNVWGSNCEIQLVAFHQKHKLDNFPIKLKPYTDNIKALNEIELQRNGIVLSVEEDRIIRIFTRRVNGLLCSLTSIGGGLSGVRVFRIIITAENGSLIHDSVCKIGTIESIRDEDSRYTKYISRLKPEATPRKLALLEHGAKKQAGVFYGLAEGFSYNAFSTEIITNKATEVINTLENLMINWYVESQERKYISDIRRRVLSDQKTEEIINTHNLEWVKEFEEKRIQVRWGTAHGDLHGLNILVSEDGTPNLIDYGDTAEGPSTLDPITLEFSIFFHPEGPLRSQNEWPTPEQSENWGNLETYLVGCPYPEFVRACRTWARKISAGEREIAAVGYSYFLRQLKYETGNYDRTLHLLRGAERYYSST